jgi:hypothetical protein
MSDLGYNQAVTLPETNIPRLGDVQTLRQPLSYETARAFRSPASYKAAKAAVLNNSLNVALSPPLDIFRSTPCQKNESDLVINVIPHLVWPEPPIDRLATPLFDQRLSSGSKPNAARIGRALGD